jgi:hypothetical protein
VSTISLGERFINLSQRSRLVGEGLDGFTGENSPLTSAHLPSLSALDYRAGS